MKSGIIVLVVVAVLALLVGGMYVSSRNQMVVKNEAVKSAWAEVDVVLQRRRRPGRKDVSGRRERDRHQESRSVPKAGANLARPAPEHTVRQRHEAVHRNGHGPQTRPPSRPRGERCEPGRHG